ncbi:MAG TPA: ABC transporter ATP-binding protein, partial [Longimicrobiales bacterium]
MADAKKKGKQINLKNVREEARALVWENRGTLAVGLLLMAVNRVAGLVMPYMPKLLGDYVITPRRPDRLGDMALIAAVATVLQVTSSFALSKVVSVAGQRAIARMRETVQQHVMRLPVSYFDSTKSGVLISRIMNDPEGIRNLIGTGLVQLVGGLVTAIIAFVVLLKLHWQLTLATVVFLLIFALVISYAMSKLRPIFRKRGEITAEVTGRLAESLGGVRLVKTYVAEEREERVF